MTDYTALKAELQRYAPLVPLCADALAAIEELERDAKRWRSSAAPAPEPVAWRRRFRGNDWQYTEREPALLAGWVKEPLYAAPQPAQADEAREE